MQSSALYVCTTLITTIVSLISAVGTNIFLTNSYLWHGIGLQKSYNTGIAFSIELGPMQSFIIIGALMTIGVVAYKQATARYEQIAFGFIVGGGLANVLDRLPDGRVTDMLRVGSFPIFNVADVCINIGVLILIAHSLHSMYIKN